MKFLITLAFLAPILSASAFVGPQHQASRSFTVRKLVAYERSALKMSAVDDDNDDIFSKVSMPDFNMESFDIVKVRENLMDGEFGTRGEAFAAAQLALLLCIVGGGVPIVGDFLMVLLGPGLAVAGIGATILSVKDLGNNLSPWVAPPKGGNLAKEGIYAELRHPLYAGLLSTMAGFSIITGSASRLLLTGILFYIFNVMADKEEEALIEEYPEYMSYKKEVTGRFFPVSMLQQLPWNKDD